MHPSRIKFLLVSAISLAFLAAVTVGVQPTGLRLAATLAVALLGYGGGLWLLSRGLSKPKVERRRFHALRTATDRFLLDVRRLSGVQLALELRQMSAAEAKPEIDTIQQHMRQLIEEMREVAAKVTLAAQADAG